MSNFILFTLALPADTFILASDVVVSRKLNFLKLKRYKAVNFWLDGGSDIEPPLFYLLVEQPLRQGTDSTSRVDVVEMKRRVG
ncbi:MAG: hypothetical protein RXN92_06910 [Thermoplasmatales archaeon]